MTAVNRSKLPGRLARLTGRHADALEAALISGILVVPTATTTDEFFEWSDVADAWTDARRRAGLASIVIIRDVAACRATLRYQAWPDRRRRASEVTTARLGVLVDSLRAQGLLESDGDTAGQDDPAFATFEMSFTDALRIAEAVKQLEREICWPSHRTVAEVMLT